MGKILLKAVPTGRQWGDKVDPKITDTTIAGVKCTLTEIDSWEGGSVPGEGVKQQYHRTTWLGYPNPVWKYG